MPAAIAAVLAAIGQGARYVICADISGFFTRIPKSTVSGIISAAVNDPEFMTFFSEAIRVELANMDQLRRYAEKFPIEDIGIAQGNSLSPLLGNILLYDFDKKMNAGDCRCIRYIDDFIILAPTALAAAARMQLARRLLTSFTMELSPEKSLRAPVAVEQGFEFLGIELVNGFIRPSRKAQSRFLSNIDDEFRKSIAGFSACGAGQPFSKSLSLISTLKRVDGIVRGWGKHYRFCNDELLFRQLDVRVNDKIGSYIAQYAAVRERTSQHVRRTLLGVEELSAIDRQPFAWPKKAHIKPGKGQALDEQLQGPPP